MRAVLQRVSRAAVQVGDELVGQIGCGWLVLLGVGSDDNAADGAYIVQKILNLRAFPDADGKMNLSLGEVGGEVLLVSQFTLYGDCRAGRRPGFSAAAPPQVANALYEGVAQSLRDGGVRVAMGRFQASMDVSLVNDGPVTLLLESRKAF